MPHEHQTHSRYEKIVVALLREPGVTFSDPGAGKGRPFGSHALKVNGKIFCMLDRLSRFIVKLPSDRVTTLLLDGSGVPFMMGKGRMTKEWIVLEQDDEELWFELAYQSLHFVRETSSVRNSR